MFTIPIGDILSSYTGDSKEFSFSGAIYDGYYEDIQFLKDLSFTIKIIALDDGVEVIFENLETEIIYEKKKTSIHIGGFERTFVKNRKPSDPDDIYPIKTSDMSIDLAPIIREEIIMASYSL